ncbi:MAG: hypothetical protein AB7W37_15005, partial [Syntrophobacteraceae bacterium]
EKDGGYCMGCMAAVFIAPGAGPGLRLVGGSVALGATLTRGTHCWTSKGVRRLADELNKMGLIAN